MFSAPELSCVIRVSTRPAQPHPPDLAGRISFQMDATATRRGSRVAAVSLPTWPKHSPQSPPRHSGAMWYRLLALKVITIRFSNGTLALYLLVLLSRLKTKASIQACAALTQASREAYRQLEDRTAERLGDFVWSEDCFRASVNVNVDSGNAVDLSDIG